MINDKLIGFRMAGFAIGFSIGAVITQRWRESDRNHYVTATGFVPTRVSILDGSEYYEE